MRPGKVKEVGLDIVADIVGSFFIILRSRPDFR